MLRFSDVRNASPAQRQPIQRVFEMKSVWWVVFFIGVILVTGLVFILNRYKDVSEGLASRKWPATTGTVVSQEIQSYEIGDSESGVTTRYRVVINYEFQVYGYLYRGTRLRIGKGGYSDQSDASDALERLIDGSQCKVFYNPSDPNNCTLIQGARAELFLAPTFGLMLILFSIWLTWRSRSGTLEL